jgi:DNA-3-methyladenine glycosylase
MMRRRSIRAAERHFSSSRIMAQIPRTPEATRAAQPRSAHASLAHARVLPRAFYARSPLVVARELLGMHLAHDDGTCVRVGRIVETEAYKGPHDLAAHSARGRRTARTEVLFGPAGHAYVYFIYGVWNCLNIVTGAVGEPHAVLLRALEPIANLSEPTWGPGLLCRALKVDRSLNDADLCAGPLWIERPAGRKPAVRVARSARIGVEYAQAWAMRRWRFFDRDSPYVSSVSAAMRRRATQRSDGLRAPR